MINEIKSLSIESKSNGIIVILNLDYLSPDNNVSAWQATSGWFYLTIFGVCLLYTSPSPRDATLSRMPSSA